MTYFSFGVLTFFNTPHGADVVRGGWLIAIVATESLVMLGSAVARTFGALEPGIFVLLHMFWGIGLALYGIYIALFAYRIFFFAVVPDDLTPILWVVMGAAAISTNAGADLILNGSGVAFLTPCSGASCFRWACILWRAFASRWRRTFPRCGWYRIRWCGLRLPHGSRRARDWQRHRGRGFARPSAVLIASSLRRRWPERGRSPRAPSRRAVPPAPGRQRRRENRARGPSLRPRRGAPGRAWRRRTPRAAPRPRTDQGRAAQPAGGPWPGEKKSAAAPADRRRRIRTRRASVRSAALCAWSGRAA